MAISNTLFGAGQGLLGGAAAGAPLGVPGAVAGGIVGAIGGGIASVFDEDEFEKLAAQYEAAEAQYQKALGRYQENVSNAAVAARENFKQAMASKGAADAKAVSDAISEAERQADRAGLIGSEKADYVSQARQRVEQARASSSPAVFQQALGGANQSRALEIQKAATELGLAENKYRTDLAVLSQQQAGGNAAAFGAALGSIGTGLGALAGAGVIGPNAKKAPETAKDTVDLTTSSDPLIPGGVQSSVTGTDLSEVDDAVANFRASRAQSAAAGAGTATPMGGDAPIDTSVYGSPFAPDTSTPIAYDTDFGPEPPPNLGESPTFGREAELDMFGTSIQESPNLGESDFPEGLMGAPPPNLGQSVDLGRVVAANPNIGGMGAEAYLDQFRTSQQALPGSAGVRIPEYKHGGVAGMKGPEVAMVGEAGPELVLNPRQTRQLAQAFGPARTVRSAPTTAVSPSRAGGSSYFGSPEELIAYMNELVGS